MIYSAVVWLFFTLFLGLLQFWLMIGISHFTTAVDPGEQLARGVLLFFASGVAMRVPMNYWDHDAIGDSPRTLRQTAPMTIFFVYFAIPLTVLLLTAFSYLAQFFVPRDSLRDVRLQWIVYTEITTVTLALAISLTDRITRHRMRTAAVAGPLTPAR